MSIWKKVFGKKTLLQATGESLEKLDLEASASVELLEAVEGESPKRPTFTIDAYNGGTLRVAGFYRPVVVDLTGLRAGRVTVLKGHDHSQIVGQGTAKITKSSVVVKGQVTGDYTDKNDPSHSVVAHSKNGFQWSASVGVSVDRVERVDAGATVKVNGQTFTGPIEVVRAGRLGEVSFVGVGADETASATIAASAANLGDKKMNEFEKWLQAMGLVQADLSDEQNTKLHAKFDAEQGKAGNSKKIEASGKVKPADETDPLEQSRIEAANEELRKAGIRKVCGEKHGELCAKAIRENWTTEKAELEVLKASRPTAPAVHTSQPTDADETVLEAAVLMGAPAVKVEGQYDATVLEAAHKQFGRGGLGVGELVLMAAERNTGRRYSFRRDGMKEILQAAFSTLSLPGILSNIANKFLLAGYNYGDNSDQSIVAIRPVNDFKAVTSFRMTGNDKFIEVGPDGELKHGELSEDSFTNQAKTYGIMFGLTRQHIINDDLGAFDQMQRKIGQGAAKKRREVVWTAFMKNAAFFTSGNGNYMAGADTVLSMDSLTIAEQMLMDQTDKNGEPISVLPKLLVVPTALSGEADKYYKSSEIRDTTASTKYPVANIHAGKYQPVVSTYLGNRKITGHSAKAWYLLADPQELPTIEVCYLNGVQQPTIETADADFNTLGVQMRGYFDFGVAMQDPKGGVKMKGEA